MTELSRRHFMAASSCATTFFAVLNADAQTPKDKDVRVETDPIGAIDRAALSGERTTTARIKYFNYPSQYQRVWRLVADKNIITLHLESFSGFVKESTFAGGGLATAVSLRFHLRCRMFRVAPLDVKLQLYTPQGVALYKEPVTMPGLDIHCVGGEGYDYSQEHQLPSNDFDIIGNWAQPIFPDEWEGKYCGRQ